MPWLGWAAAACLRLGRGTCWICFAKCATWVVVLWELDGVGGHRFMCVVLKAMDDVI